MKLSAYLYLYFRFFLYDIPFRISKFFTNILKLINNEFALSLNFTNLFTPLFNDFSIVGRAIGFIYRIIRVFIGTVVLLSLFLIQAVILALYYLFPLAGFFYIGMPILFIFPVSFLVLIFYVVNNPVKRVREVKNDYEIEQCFNFAKSILEKLKVGNSDFARKLLCNKQISELLKFTELSSNKSVQDIYSNIVNLQLDLAVLKKDSYNLAKENNSRYIEPEHFFLAVMNSIIQKDKMLSTYSLTSEILKDAAFSQVNERERLCRIFPWQYDFVPPIIGGVNRAQTARITPLLNSVSQDFTKMAEKGFFDRVVGKEKAISKAVEVLERASNRNVLVIGEPGCGKTMMVKGIAQVIVGGTMSSALAFKRLVAIDPGSLIAGCRSSGEITERLTKVFKEIIASQNIIIFIDEIHSLVSASGGNADLATVFNTLIPYLENDSFQLIGATTIAEYRKYIEPNGAFTRLFNVVNLDEASDKETLEILKTLVKKYKEQYGVEISYIALTKAVELSRKLIKDRVLPDKAVSIIESACVIKSKSKDKFVTAEVVSEVVSDITHVPVSKITEDESVNLLNIETKMGERVIGQSEAINQLGDALRRARVGIRDEKRPIASFLFVGSTGIGKTETAKALAETYFGREDIMVRLDMSEYQKDDSIDRLIGTSDGVRSGVLTDQVRKSPFSLILLDELEKASSKVLLAFLQVLDDGRLTDSSGRVVDFSNSIIIATSNAGTSVIQEIIVKKGSYKDMSEAVYEEIKKYFAPEFINRFSGVIVFKPLNFTSVLQITNLLLSKVVKNMTGKGIKISFSETLALRLAREGYDEKWGARPLRRLIENTVESYIARKVISKEFTSGNEYTLSEEVFQ